MVQVFEDSQVLLGGSIPVYASFLIAETGGRLSFDVGIDVLVEGIVLRDASSGVTFRERVVTKEVQFEGGLLGSPFGPEAAECELDVLQEMVFVGESTKLMNIGVLVNEGQMILDSGLSHPIIMGQQNVIYNEAGANLLLHRGLLQLEEGASSEESFLLNEGECMLLMMMEGHKVASSVECWEIGVSSLCMLSAVLAILIRRCTGEMNAHVLLKFLIFSTLQERFPVMPQLQSLRFSSGWKTWLDWWISWLGKYR